jgi:nucleoside-diphosphate-sugar epimerase
MKILVTGGGGFLGRAIVRRLLARGDLVRVFSRSPQPGLVASGVECVRGDVGDAAAVRDACAGRDAVIHTAAKAGVWGATREFHATNVIGTQHVLDACRATGVGLLVYTSTPSVVYTGGALAGANESLPLLARCPCAYPMTKAEAERRVLAANSPGVLHTTALRPHLIWGVGDPHLIPRVVARARAGRLRIVGGGRNRVDLTHVENAAHAHLLALDALRESRPRAAGRAYFISDSAPVRLWEWVNVLLDRLGIAPVRKRIPFVAAYRLGALTEVVWRVFPLSTEPPMTRFVATELAEDHWFDITAARRDLAYSPVVDTVPAFDALVGSLRGGIKHVGK